jgi:glycoside/pentoside/hexuronide:cation symporter, GPH family
MVRPLPRITAPATRARLSTGAKAIYGFGDLLIAIRMSSFQFYLLPFYTDVVMLAPWLAGLGKMVGMIWDGINDPVTGYLSDRARTRIGRRRPFLLGAALPLGLAFAALWSPPSGLGTGPGFAYLVVVFLVLDTAFSCYTTPYLALGAELSPDYHERTQLAASRAFFHLIGLFLGVAIPAAVLARMGGGAGAFRVMGIGMGAGMVAVALVTGTLLREPPLVERAAVGLSLRSFAEGFASTFRNPSFRVLIATFAFVLLGGGLYQMLVPYAFKYWLSRPELVGRAPLAFVFASVLSLPLWTRLARRLGKDRAMRVCMLWAVIALGTTPLVLDPAMGQLRMLLFVGFAGLGNGGWIVLPAAITADVIDWDELHTARRREGAYFGIWTLVMKWGNAVASGIVGIALQLLGFVPNQAQTEATITGIKILYGPVPAALMLAAFLVFLRFPLTRERHEEVQAALAARRAS